jgi:hypothetical protein
LLHELLKPFPSLGEDAHITGINVEETRVRATALLSKLFLQYVHRCYNCVIAHITDVHACGSSRFLPQLALLPEFHGQLWLQILQFLEMYMSADHGGFLVCVSHTHTHTHTHSLSLSLSQHARKDSL